MASTAKTPRKTAAKASEKVSKATRPAKLPLRPATQAASEGAAAPAKAPRRRVAVKRSTLGPIGKLEDFIPYKMSVVANKVSQSIGKLFETRFNIQIPEWRIVMVLYAYGDLVFNEVVDRTSMDKARVSRAQRRLVDLGMIENFGDVDDGRKVILSLTPSGAQLCETILPEAAKREAWFLEALDDEEHKQLDIILDKLMKRSLEL